MLTPTVVYPTSSREHTMSAEELGHIVILLLHSIQQIYHTNENLAANKMDVYMLYNLFRNHCLIHIVESLIEK